MKFDTNNLSRRRANRDSLLEEVGLTGRRPVACTVSRITAAKGFRFLVRNIDKLISEGFDLLVVGDGEPKLIAGFQEAVVRYPDNVRIITPYSERTARRILAGSDLLLMPSLIEPFGLSLVQAQAYGCVPVVSAVGGLTASVVTCGGFLFQPSDSGSFEAALRDAARLYARPQQWRDLQATCMTAARHGLVCEGKYLAVYEMLCGRSRL